MNQNVNQAPLPVRQQGTEGLNLDIRRLLYTYLHNWYWIILALIGGFVIARIYLRYTTTIYEVSGTVFIDKDKKESFSQEAIVSDFGFTPSSDVSDELQILRSRDLMLRVVDSLGIDVIIYGEGRVKDSEQYINPPVEIEFQDAASKNFSANLRFRILDDQDFVILNGEQDTLLGRFNEPMELNETIFILKKLEEVKAGEVFRIELISSEKVAASYAKKLKVNQVEESNVIKLSLEDPVTQKAEAIITTLIDLYNERVMTEKNEAGRNTLAFIDERLGFITEELYDVEQEVEGFKKSNEVAVDLSVRAENYLEQVQILDQQKTELELQQQMLAKMTAYLDLNDFRSLPVSEDILGVTLNLLIKEYNQLIFERKSFLESATAENPLFSSFGEKLGYLQDNIRLAIRTMSENLDNRMATIQERMKPLEERIARVPFNERQLLQIMRQQQIKEQLFLFLLQKREETALSVAAQTTDARILDRPTKIGPVKPQSLRIYAIALMFGMAFPIGLLTLKVILDNKIRSREDLEDHTNIPYLGSIAQGKSNETPIVVKKGSRSAIAEMFRLLRTNLFFNAAGNKSQVILITSSISGEGKTFITINLGSSLALSGKKTLLVGLDLRKPKLAMYLTQHKDHKGVTNYLIGEENAWDSLIQPIPGHDNLFFLPCGSLPPNPAELLMTDRLKKLMQELKGHYDHILIDSSPVGLVTDALLLKAELDQTIVVTRFAFTTNHLVRMLEELYQRKKLPRMGIVLNGVKASARYGYGYGYGYGYYSDDKKRRKWFK